MKKSFSAAGLYLWEVRISKYFNGHFWITTSTPSLNDATSKAQTFIDRNYPPDCRITSVRENGTIDA